MISLRQLRSFVAVYEEGSFTAAAEREGATQSGMSHHVGQLEDELGTMLFERSGRAVTPTRAGELYYEECIAVLQRLEAARQRVADQRFTGAIRIGLMPTFTRALLPPVLEKFLAAAPAAQISVIEAYSGVLTEMVRRGELDFAAVPAFAGTDGIVHRPLVRDRETLVRARRRGGKSLALGAALGAGSIESGAAGAAEHAPRQYRDLFRHQRRCGGAAAGARCDDGDVAICRGQRLGRDPAIRHDGRRPRR